MRGTPKTKVNGKPLKRNLWTRDLRLAILPRRSHFFIIYGIYRVTSRKRLRQSQEKQVLQSTKMSFRD